MSIAAGASAWLTACALAPPPSAPADAERGLPLVSLIEPAAYDSPATPVGAQAFDLERLADASLLVANNEGLLRLDGTGWSTWNPLTGVVFAVAAGRDGRIYLGGVGDFGWA